MLSNLNPDQKNKLDSLINHGVQVNQEIKLRRESLNEAIKELAEELDVKPKVLRRAIKVSENMSFQEEQDEFDSVETILKETGRSV